MDSLRARSIAVLKAAAGQIQHLTIGQDYGRDLLRMADAVVEPCVVAVVGRVKAGKSSFINALLGQDLAAVGTVETTATINRFRYGEPANPDRPVRCHWKGGSVTDEPRAFLDGLQGHDLETIRRAEGIELLEYFLPHPLLRDMTLVDTPGTGAAVSAHEDRTAEFLRLESRLREQHDAETRRLQSEADAVIYLVGPAAMASDKALLEEFTAAFGGESRSFNALGVLAKVDLSPSLLERRHELAQRIAGQLEGSVNTVVPVSAGLRRALDTMTAADGRALARLVEELRRIPPETLSMLLDSSELFTELELDDCPLTPAERRELIGLIDSGGTGSPPWQGFATIGRLIADHARTIPHIEAGIADAAGFERLHETLRTHFLERGHILRCHRAVTSAREILDTLRFEHLPRARQAAAEDGPRLRRFLGVFDGNDAREARELRTFLKERLDGEARHRALEKTWQELDLSLARLAHELLDHNADFEALRSIDHQPEAFSDQERDELRSLLGLYGLDWERRLASAGPGRAAERQLHWRGIANRSPRGSLREAVAERAANAYGAYLAEAHDCPS